MEIDYCTIRESEIKLPEETKEFSFYCDGIEKIRVTKDKFFVNSKEINISSEEVHKLFYALLETFTQQPIDDK